MPELVYYFDTGVPESLLFSFLACPGKCSKSGEGIFLFFRASNPLKLNNLKLV